MKSNYVAPRFTGIEKNTKKKSNLHEINSIHLQDISINHNNEILNTISLHLKPGFTYGFVGSAEKRKLLIGLLRGVITPVTGSIFINNTTDIRNVDDWHSYITLLEKGNQFFTEDAAYQLESAEKDSICDLTRAALFETTSNTLLKTSPILILDEATSSVNIELEERILQQLCLKNKNNIIIFNTTRPSSLKYCDHIFLLKNNRISEISKQIYFSDFPEIFSGSFDSYYSESVF